jgi:hypothetical protein
MTEPAIDATVRLAFWARGLAREKPRRLVVSHSDAEWARMRALSEAVDRTSAWRYTAIGAVLTFLILVFGIGAIVVLTAFGTWAAVELGVLDPATPANDIWAVTLVCGSFVIVGAIGVTLLAMLAPPRLAAVWAAREDLRARLVPQPGDAALLAKCERKLILSVLGLVAVPALIWFAWAAVEWLPRTERLVLLILVLMTPVAAAQVVRRWRAHSHAG